MYQLTKLEELLKLLCANKAMQQQLVEALEEQITAVDTQAKESALKALFDESAKPVAYGALSLRSYLEDLRDFVKNQ